MVVYPAVTPSIVEVAEFTEFIVPGPLILVQVPVPGVAALPARVKVLVLHCIWSEPAAAVGALYKVIWSEVLQLPLVMVHCNTVLVPMVTSVTVVVGEVASEMVPSPLILVQSPVPGAAALAAMVKVVVLLQRYRSGPAAAWGALSRSTSS